MELAEWIAACETEVAVYRGTYVDRVPERITRAVQLSTVAIPTEWPRPGPEADRWTESPYRRGDREQPSPEHAIEAQILGTGGAIAAGRTCFGGTIVGGINAIPLTLNPKIEADVLLLVEEDGAHRLYLAEVKSMSNNAWYAAVELLRQLCLFRASTHAADYFHRLDPSAVVKGAPLTGLVLAPPEFFSAEGQKREAVTPARQLLAAVKNDAGLDARLAVWTDATKAIAEFPAS